jgi:hypothetical protein
LIDFSNFSFPSNQYSLFFLIPVISLYFMSFPSIEQIDANIEKIRIDYTFSRDSLEKKYLWERNDSRIVVFTKGIRVMNAIQIGISHLRKDLKHDDWWKTRYPQNSITPENKKLLMVILIIFLEMH